MKIEFAKKWNSLLQQWRKFYPITITPAIIDADRGQRLNATLASLYTNKLDTEDFFDVLDSMTMDTDTGEVYLEYDDGTTTT